MTYSVQVCVCEIVNSSKRRLNSKWYRIKLKLIYDICWIVDSALQSNICYIRDTKYRGNIEECRIVREVYRASI
jgi:hypothetical protein